MATRLQPPPEDRYATDPYAWALEQAAHLRARRFGELDLENLAEEVEDLAGAMRRSVRSRVRTIIEHLLKLEHSLGGSTPGRLAPHGAGGARRPQRRPDADTAAGVAGGTAGSVRPRTGERRGDHGRPRRGHGSGVASHRLPIWVGAGHGGLVAVASDAGGGSTCNSVLAAFDSQHVQRARTSALAQ